MSAENLLQDRLRPLVIRALPDSGVEIRQTTLEGVEDELRCFTTDPYCAGLLSGRIAKDRIPVIRFRGFSNGQKEGFYAGIIRSLSKVRGLDSES